MTIEELARDLDVPVEKLTQAIQLGCPHDDLENAAEWLKAHPACFSKFRLRRINPLDVDREPPEDKISGTLTAKLPVATLTRLEMLARRNHAPVWKTLNDLIQAVQVL